MRHSILMVLALVAVAGCNSGGRSSNGTTIPGVSNAAEPLPVDNFSYLGPPLETNRYFHSGTTLDNGQVVIIGGTDENSFTSLDTVEVFNQSLFDNPPPESISGDFIDTNFVGDPITMINGGRMFHTSTLLPDGSVIVIGGTFDILISLAIPNAEIFDPQLREFNPDGVEPVNEMRTPRFRHEATVLANGKVLISGGQESVDETIIDPNFPPGSPFFQFDITVFPSVKEFEFYNVAAREFEAAFDIIGDESELQTPRGRSDHVSIDIAGFDNRLGTSDDVVLFSSGFQTLSGVFAPDTKFPGFGDNQTALEYYDLATGINSFAPGMNVEPRLHEGRAANVGRFAEKTPDGITGVANVALFYNGDNDGGNCATSTAQSDLIICTFTGFGPGNGIQFFQNQPAAANQAIESFVADPINCAPIGRSFSDGVMGVNLRTYDGVEFVGNWVITGGGITIFPTPNGCAQIPTGICAAQVIQGFEYFDPFYNAGSTVDANGDGNPDPWDLTGTRTPANPSGVTGTWLQADDMVPDDTFDGFGETTNITGLLRRERMGHTLNMVPGEDGVINTPDDRVLVVGGGTDFYGTWGGEPVGVGSEIYLPVDANGPN